LQLVDAAHAEEFSVAAAGRDDAAIGFLDSRVQNLPWYAHLRRQVRGSDQQPVDAVHGAAIPAALASPSGLSIIATTRFPG
jgi:hypothetical protein